MKALITGGAGFIGSHLAEAIVRRGDQVRVLDNLSLGHLRNLSWSPSGDVLEIVTGDVCDTATLRRCLQGVDWVFHLAAMPSVPRSIEAPAASHEVNLSATVRLLDLCREFPVRRIVFAGSSSVYGDQDAPLKHEKLPAQPLSPYALQKYAAEQYGIQFARFHRVPFVSTRFFNVFGPRQSFDSPYSGVIAKFCTAMLAGQTPVIFGDGRQSRDFTYIDNVVDGLLRAAEAPQDRVAGQVFNLACGDRIDLLQLVADVNALTGQSLLPRFAPARAGDVLHSCADIVAARAVLGYAPSVSWAEGLRRTLDWYRQSDAVILEPLQDRRPLANG
jgi:UDP-glucose 4-epimerase